MKFFQANGPREWAHIKFTGFLESPDSDFRVAHWFGVTKPGDDSYYVSCTVDPNDLFARRSRTDFEAAMAQYAKEKEEDGRQAIDKFLLPECRCRLGLHWKCSIHQTWAN